MQFTSKIFILLFLLASTQAIAANECNLSQTVKNLAQSVTQNHTIEYVSYENSDSRVNNDGKGEGIIAEYLVGLRGADNKLYELYIYVEQIYKGCKTTSTNFYWE